MSFEQRRLLTEFKKLKATSYHEYCTLKETKQLTPATSDMFQASLTALEMHARGARWLGPGAIMPHEAVRECASRLPASQVSAMSPPEAEEWIVVRLGNSKLTGKIESNGIDGVRLLEIAKMSQKDAATALGVKMVHAKTPQLAIRRSVSTPSDTMHEKIAGMLEKCLGVDVNTRPASAKDALEMIDAAQGGSGVNFGWGSLLDDMSGAVGGAALLSLATEQAVEHPDATVATTLGSLSKALVLHGDMTGALSACAEWWGVASSDAARTEAAKAYCNLWKRHGCDNLDVLDLSRDGRGHWREGMMSGGEEMWEHLFSNVAQSGASIVSIDLSEQPALKGAVLDLLFEEISLASLITLKMKNCKMVSGSIPRSIEGCSNLQTLNLSGCGLTGTCRIRSERFDRRD